MMRVWWATLGLGYQLLIEVAVLGLISFGLWYVHHTIDMGGYNRAMAEVQAAYNKQQAEAQAEIVNIGVKYDALKKAIPKGEVYNQPVSPLAGAAIGSMPDRQAATPRQRKSMRPSNKAKPTNH